jgi:hypothetical protein
MPPLQGMPRRTDDLALGQPERAVLTTEVAVATAAGVCSSRIDQAPRPIMRSAT